MCDISIAGLGKQVTEEDSVITAVHLKVHLLAERDGREVLGYRTRYIHKSMQFGVILSLQKRNDAPHPEHLPFSYPTKYDLCVV